MNFINNVGYNPISFGKKLNPTELKLRRGEAISLGSFKKMQKSRDVQFLKNILTDVNSGQLPTEKAINILKRFVKLDKLAKM